jgi:hypothetical protein
MAESTRNVTRIRAFYFIQVLFTKMSIGDYHCHSTRQCYSIYRHKRSNNSFRKMTCVTNETLLFLVKKPTDALNSYLIGITTLHVSGSSSAHHQEFLAVHRLWSRMELQAVPPYSW